MLLEQDIFPLLGLPNSVAIPILGLIGIGISIIAVFIFPRIFAKTFLAIKSKFLYRYKNAYIESRTDAFQKRKVIMRSIYLFLLMLGLLSFILPLVEGYAGLFMENPEYYSEELGVPVIYVVTLLMSMVFFLLPIVVGLWSISWAMEDAGLMHYKFDERPGRELYEIEPIHIKYTSFLKGYAGISSIFFLINATIAWSSVTSEPRTSDIVMTILMPAITILFALPAYIIYAKYVNVTKLMRADYPELKEISEEQILKNTQ